MDDDEDVLEIGSHREPRPMLTRVLIAVALLAVVGGYFVVHGRHHGTTHQAAPTRSSAPLLPPTPVPEPSSLVAAPSPARPPWPQVAGACGNTAFVPIVSTKPLAQNTGVRMIVGDRLSTVDLDRGTVTPRAGLPAGDYAVNVATSAAGTYATLVKCQAEGVAISTIVRLEPAGVRVIARGDYAQLLSGGDHPWGVIYHDDGSTTLDPLDGGRQSKVPVDFAPDAAYRNLIVGSTAPPSNSSSQSPQTVQLMDPATDKVVRTLGVASSMTVSDGVVLWADALCPGGQCPLRAYDLATGTRLPVAGSVPRDAGVWSGVLSPDRKAFTYLRQQSTPSHFDMGHPGNPNEIATVDLTTGRSTVIPELEIWSKSIPGMAYSDDSRWLVMSFDGGSRVRLLLWHPGLARPLEPSVQLRGRVAFAPLVAVT